MATQEVRLKPEPAATNMHPGGDVLIIGVGNDFRGDDAAGLHVVRSLQTIDGDLVTTAEASGDGTALLDLWKNAGNVIMVDAVQSGKTPGTIIRFDLLREALPAAFKATSTHAFGVAEAVALAKSFGSTPDQLILFGIEGREFGAGSGLSREVREAIPPAVQSIVSEVRIIRQRGANVGCTSDGDKI